MFGLFKIIIALAICSLANVIYAVDWNQYRGPDCNSISKENLKDEVKEFKTLWKVTFNGGFSSFTVSGDKVFTLDKKSAQGILREVCVALDANSGKLIWSREVGIAQYDYPYDASPYDGPRSTPTIVDGKVYVLNARLGLFCLNAKSGEVIWQRDLVKEENAVNISWQSAASPLIVDGLVLLCCGSKDGSILGIDKDSGKTIWKSGDFGMTHSTPTVAEICDTKQIVFLTQQGLVSVLPSNGKVIWQQSFPRAASMAASPVVSGDIVYCSAGYGVGSAAYKIQKSGEAWSARELWRKPGNKFCNQWSTPLVIDGCLYGIFGFKQYKTAPLKCIEIATGNERWSQDGIGMGNLIYVNGRFLVLGDTGTLYLIAPDKTEEKIKALEGNCWSMPAYANGKIYLRSHKEGVCLKPL